MDPRTQPLFQRYPLTGRATLSTGEAPTPYHIYRGYGVFVGGTADLGAAQRLLAGEHVQPVQTAEGRALMGVWVCDFTEASLGPHHELQFSLFVARGQVTGLPAHPLGLLPVMLGRPDVPMLCHGLWNNTPVVVAYNREVLSLNARLTHSTITRAPHRVSFDFREAEGGAPLLTGAVGLEAAPRANWDLARLMGFGPLLRISRQPWVIMQVVNPLGVRLAANGVAQAFTKNDQIRLRYFDPARDTLQIHAAPYTGLGFTPHFVQFMDGFKFVYLEPQVVPAEG